MSFLDNVLHTMRLNPMDVARSGWHEISRPVVEIAQGVRRGEGLKALKDNVLSVPFNTLLGGAMLLPHLKWDNPENDSAGPMESMGNRLGGMWSALSMMSPLTFEKGMMSGMVGNIGASIGAGLGGRYGGRLLDTIFGTKKSPEDRALAFQNRIQDKINTLKGLHPQVPEPELGNQAVNEFIQENPGYDFSWANQG